MPGSYIDSMGVGHDLFNFRDDLLKIHLEAFPDVAAAALPFIRRPGVETFSFELHFFKGKNFLGWRSSGSPPLVAADLVAEKLYQVTDRIVSQWVDENTKN